MFENLLAELQVEVVKLQTAVAPLNVMEERANKVIEALEKTLNEIGVKIYAEIPLGPKGSKDRLRYDYSTIEGEWHFYVDAQYTRLIDARRKQKIKAIEYFEPMLHALLESLREEASQFKDGR